ncbi:leucine--tRNA ligase [Actinoplanes sp. NPDC051411]|uniref:leucine--tRNA ligase n=1 Tax=Actinoplanes sp. NPDC051411 TaxID=3155522 RepID=UPI003437CFC5
MATEGYDFEAMQRRWQPVWQSLDLFAPRGSGERRYVVDMFAYPSGDLHMGHAEAYAFGDAIARYWIQRGYDVLHPIGWDSFGLPAENAAIKRDQHPATWTYANIETQAESFRRYAVSVDWRTRLHTSDPSYYRWTQWLFLRFFERGLAYRARAAVNWCPADRTVLANEQVIDGHCERCGAEVEPRDLTQWFFRITSYADRLLDDMDALTGHWPEPVLTMQRNWIGRSPDGTSYRLRDWLVSRQRFWGCPIPIVHCPACGEVPVPDDQLPVTVPDPRGAASPATPCPRCGRPGTRDTDTMDTFVDSSWYFLRYPSIDYAEGPFDPAATKRWLPVDQYVGGVEHATMHLLYARFFTKVLHDMGLVEFTEPFRALLNQGQVILDGAAMSKSKGNLVDLGEQLTTYGVDAVRLTMLFAGPPEDDIDWADVSPSGAVRFLSRALRLADDVPAGRVADDVPAGRVADDVPAGRVADDVPAGRHEGSPTLRRTTHRLLREITALVESRRFNVALARTMQLVNAAREAIDEGGAAASAVREAVEAVAVVLSLFTPYTAEEMWSRLGHEPGIARAGWPAIDPALAAEATVVCVVQVNGRIRDRLEVPPDITGEALAARAFASPAVAAAVGGRPVTRTIVRPPKLVNLIVPAT